MKELAQKLDITPITLSRNLSKDKPKPTTFKKLGDALNIDAAALEKMYKDDELFKRYIEAASFPRLIIPKNPNITVEDDDSVPLRENLSSENVFKEDNSHKIHNGYIRNTKSKRNNISATINYKGTLLKAGTLRDIMDITNVLLSLERMKNKEQHDSIIAILIKQYGSNQ